MTAMKDSCRIRRWRWYIYAHQIICISSIFKTLCAMESMFYVKSRWWRMLSSLKECFELARSSNLFLMEAEKTLFTPLNRKLKQLVKEGVIGQLRYVEGSYSYPIDLSEMEEDHWCFSKEAGGSVYDVGVYPICYANWFSDGCISDIQAVKDCAAGGYDMFTQALLTYDNGVIARCAAAGSSGWITAECCMAVREALDRKLLGRIPERSKKGWYLYPPSRLT